MLDSYENFSDEVKKYLNKAMDIYVTIENENIKKRVKTFVGPADYFFTKLDKKILSLYIAVF